MKIYWHIIERACVSDMIYTLLCVRCPDTADPPLHYQTMFNKVIKLCTITLVIPDFTIIYY